MKNQLLSLIVAALAAIFTLTPAILPAQDDQDEEAGPSKEERERQLEELKKKNKAEEKLADATVRKMLKVFKPLAGEWTGTEKVEHSDEALKLLDKEWKDTWKGFYTVDGRYFEMTGQTEGEESTSYRWICTWDVREETYKAWYFGEISQTLYTGVLSGDGKHVIWSMENEANNSETKFSMIPDGDRVKCSGTDKFGGQLWSRQSSSYTRKKVEL